MSTLYVFGCSFSAKYSDEVLNDPEILKYYNFRGQNFPPTWSDLLANDLDVKLNNTGRWGADNYEIFEKFCEKSELIKKNDIVIIGWTGIDRFRLYSENLNDLRSVNVWGKNQNKVFNNISDNTIDEILVNRDNERWADEIRNYIKLINKLSDSVGFKTIHWSFFNYFPELLILPTLFELGAGYITHETNGKVINEHMGEKGHVVQYEYFKQLLNNYENNYKLD